jgi:hypothetical protein
MGLCRFIIFLFLVACGMRDTEIILNKTTKSDLVASKGDPENVGVTSGGEIYHYPRGESYQIQKGIVTHSFKDAKVGEHSLLFWKHAFKDCVTDERKIDGDDSSIELNCPKLGLSVIYREGSEFVKKVVDHGKN